MTEDFSTFWDRHWYAIDVLSDNQIAAYGSRAVACKALDLPMIVTPIDVANARDYVELRPFVEMGHA